MADWTVISSLASAGGTLVLALATFVSVRSANRSARVAEQGLPLSRRPLLMPSRLDDRQIEAMCVDEHWARIDPNDHEAHNEPSRASASRRGRTSNGSAR